MAIKKYKPTSPGRRFMTVSEFDEITSTTPERSLLAVKKKSGGRNSYGRITVRHIGGGNRVKYRIIDWKRNKDGIPAKVASIQYDPNRSANIALLNYADGEKRYILAPLGLNVGDTVVSGKDADIKVGNALPLENIPVGTMVHNVELHPGKGGQLVRSAGNAAQLMAKEGKYATVKLPSGEMRLLPIECRATMLCPHVLSPYGMSFSVNVRHNSRVHRPRFDDEAGEKYLLQGNIRCMWDCRIRGETGTTSAL